MLVKILTDKINGFKMGDVIETNTRHARLLVQKKYATFDLNTIIYSYKPKKEKK